MHRGRDIVIIRVKIGVGVMITIPPIHMAAFLLFPF